ncbi:hypothetical protein Tco_0998923 [Tanacetum coccineum]
MAQALSSRIFTLELRDLPHKINQTVNEIVKEAVHAQNSLQLLSPQLRKLLILEKLLPAPPKDTNTAHLRKIRTIPDWLKPVPEEDRPATPEPEWVIPPNDLPKTENNWANALANSYQDPDEYKLLRHTGDMIRPFHDNNISLQFQMEEYHLLLTDQVDLVNPEGDKGRRSALSISKLKASQYLDFGLEELVPSLWIESERDYDISAAYEIVLHKADYNEYKISEADFKNMHLNDFEDLYLLHLQEDYTIVSKPMAVIYRDRNDQKKMMQETEVHKFSDGTLNKILDKLDYMVKDFKLFKYNPSMEIRIWFEDDKRRSKEFMEVIERRLKIRIIFKSIESFVGGRLRDVDYRLIQRTE